jgi:hypothetical protein
MIGPWLVYFPLDFQPSFKLMRSRFPDLWLVPGNTKGGSIIVPLTSCLTGLELAVWQLTIFVFIF